MLSRVFPLIPERRAEPGLLRLAYKNRLQAGPDAVRTPEMKSLSLIALAVAAVLTSSCNTFIGLGRDMRIAGESMENTANKATGGSGGGDTSGAPVY